jgi:V-type H+-transporting ATPase subunit C
MVVPRSSIQVAADDEFTLYAVTTFKKHSAEFIHKCREKRWTPRDFKYTEGGKDAEAKEVESLSKEERKLWGEALRLGRTGYSESAMVLVHVLALRVFVETVLRYGLPLDFVCGLVQVLLNHLSLTTLYLSSLDLNETSEESKNKSRRSLFILGRKCLWSR